MGSEMPLGLGLPEGGAALTPAVPGTWQALFVTCYNPCKDSLTRDRAGAFAGNGSQVCLATTKMSLQYCSQI